MKYVKQGRGEDGSLDAFAERMCNVMLSMVRREINRESNYLSRGVITIPQLHVLHYLSGQPSCRMHDVAVGLGVKGSTLTGLMDRLVELGLVRRFNSDEDRRVVLAAITAKGETILRGLKADRKRMIMRVFGNITARDRQTYIEILEKVAASVRAQGEVGGKGRERPA